MITSWIPGLASAWQPVFDEGFPEKARGSVRIAPPDEALTFARADDRLVAVTGYERGLVSAVDLAQLFGDDGVRAGVDAGRRTGDAVAMFRAQGYDAIRDAVASAPPAARLELAETQLGIAVDFGSAHIAVGTNYPEHAKDAGTTRPFLFPKIVQPGRSGSEVSTYGGLLDYEVEIAAVPLAPLAAGEQPEFLGLMLANDFTDRATLMRVVDRGDIESGKGFTTGKSFPGYLPVGNLFVIPRDWRSFVPALELRLFVNDRLRQRSKASEMVWDVGEMLARIHERRGRCWEHRGAEFPLFEGETIPERTLILTGTPHGTVFDGMPLPVVVAGLLRWIAGGWSKSVPENVIDAYVDAATETRAYLQPGDRVRIQVERLGAIDSLVVR